MTVHTFQFVETMSNVVPSLCSVALINMEKAFQACFEKLTEETNEIGSLLKLRVSY